METQDLIGSYCIIILLEMQKERIVAPGLILPAVSTYFSANHLRNKCIILNYIYYYLKKYLKFIRSI